MGKPDVNKVPGRQERVVKVHRKSNNRSKQRHNPNVVHKGRVTVKKDGISLAEAIHFTLG